jgi:transcriptional regulator with XRE-family HTH domain
MNHAAWWVYDTAELGMRVRRARHGRGLQQEELAGRLGVTRMTVSRLERGQSVSVDTAIRALSECGYALVVAPKFARVEVDGAS